MEKQNILAKILDKKTNNNTGSVTIRNIPQKKLDDWKVLLTYLQITKAEQGEIFAELITFLFDIYMELRKKDIILNKEDIKELLMEIKSDFIKKIEKNNIDNTNDNSVGMR